MSKISMIGTIKAQPGKGDEMATVLAEMVEAAKSEPGVEVYSYHRGRGDESDAFWFYALMTDEASMQGHGQSEAMKAAMAAFMPLMAEPPQMTVTDPVGAIGLDL
jgi:quinol monooxygenase YgiN